MVWCCDVVQRQVLNVVMRCGMVVWCMGNVVVCCDARCEMWLWNTERCGMVWRHIRHGVMQNEMLKCSVGCVVWFGMCAVQFVFECGDVHGVMWDGMWAWCEVECGRDVEWWAEMWFDVNYGAMWNVVWCVCEIWCDAECCNFRHGVMY